MTTKFFSVRFPRDVNPVTVKDVFPERHNASEKAFLAILSKYN